MEDSIGSLWTHWHGHPDVLIGLAAFEAFYLLGVGPLRERYGLAASVEPIKVATFTAGVLVIFVALVSPLHELSDKYLFSAHMLQHILLTLVAPPLLIKGIPPWLLRPLLRPVLAYRAARMATHPILAFALFNIVFSLWHMPTLYNLSMTNHGVHVFEHLIMMATAVLMWWPITSSMPELPRLSYPLQMIYLFMLSIAQIIVFAPVTFSKEPLYEWYVNAPAIWSVPTLVDQQIGAIIMKMGGGAIFLVLIVVAFFKWYHREEEKTVIRAPEPEYQLGPGPMAGTRS